MPSIIWFKTCNSFLHLRGNCLLKRADYTSGAGTAYPSGAPEFTPGFQWSSCYSIYSFMCIFCRSLFVLLYFFFLLAIVLSVLRYTDYDHPFAIFKLFLHSVKKKLEQKLPKCTKFIHLYICTMKPNRAVAVVISLSSILLDILCIFLCMSGSVIFI